MAELPRPDVPPGPRRDLVDALHALHHEAGWPSLRVLAREAGCSRTTVSKVFSAPRLPSWGVLELVVEAMDGDTRSFHDLWLAASTPEAPRSALETRIAGRKPELAAVRRHLETGTGLLLVTGEAGIGKTKLVTTAAASVDRFVAIAHCRPLSTQVPLLPIADALRQALVVAGGAWLDESLATCPPYVASVISQLLPEIGAGSVHDGGWARDQLLQAIIETLVALDATSGFALLLEDLPWADPATLDVVDLLATRRCRFPVLTTWRTNDQRADSDHDDWLARVQRHATMLELDALTFEETVEQIRMLRAHQMDSDTTARIHALSHGQPLYTEQLTTHIGSGEQGLPAGLAALFSHSLARLSEPAWRLARTLAVADRPLSVGQLEKANGLERGCTPALRELDSHRLLAPADGPNVRLRHPLVAEAMRQHLAPGEGAEVHRRVAEVLAVGPHPPAAEIAGHWQATEEDRQELVWRVRAARAARERFAMAEEAAQWQRALELWPPDLTDTRGLSLRKSQAVVAALKALRVTDEAAAADLARRSVPPLLPGLDPLAAAELMQLAGACLDAGGDMESGLQLLQGAVAIYEEQQPSAAYALALSRLGAVLDGAGRFDEAKAAAARCYEIALKVGDTKVLREALIEKAGYDIRSGALDTALSAAREATAITVDNPYPEGDIRVAGQLTGLLLLAGADVDDVVAAGTAGLESAATWGLSTNQLEAARFNVAQAMRRAGQVDRAARFLAPHSDWDPRYGGSFIHMELARIELLTGNQESATRLVDRLWDQQPLAWILDRLKLAECAGSVDAWTGRPAKVLDRLVPLAEEVASTDAAADLGPILALSAQAAADLAAEDPTAGPAFHERLRRVHHRCRRDPFASRQVPADGAAWTATWEAELARLGRSETLEHWLRAANAWERLRRPHEAAYCRWRAAQVALSTGHGTIAGRLLKRAASEAGEHLPLTAAIARTASPGGS